jgi:hypothetical protein
MKRGEKSLQLLPELAPFKRMDKSLLSNNPRPFPQYLINAAVIGDAEFVGRFAEGLSVNPAHQ